MLCLPNGILHNLYNIYQIKTTQAISIDKALRAVGIDTDIYTKPENITATKGKNIVVIILESFEKGYLQKDNGNLTPHLNKLAKQWNIYDMEQTQGCSWSSGSLYCHQTGLPAYFNHNIYDWVDGREGQPAYEIFQNSVQSQIVGLGNVLNKANYNVKAFMGNSWYGAKGDLLKAYGISTITKHNTIGKYQRLGFEGMYDKDLFNEAKLQLEQMTKISNNPFALFISTVGTHNPPTYDKRMEPYIHTRYAQLSTKDDIMGFAAAATDYLVDDFIQYLKSKKLLDKTVIYIFPDHQSWQWGANYYPKDYKKNQLYLLSNANNKELNIPTKRKIYQLDLPRLIINGANIKTNAKFLVDFLTVEDVNKYIIDKKIDITTLNSSALKRENIRNGFMIKITNNKIAIINNDDELIESVAIDKSNGLWVGFDADMNKLSSHHKFKLIDQKRDPKTDNFHFHLSVKYENGQITSYLGDSHATNIIKTGKTVHYTKQDINYVRVSSEKVNTFIKTYPPIQPPPVEKTLLPMVYTDTNIRPNRDNICYSDKNWTISYRKGYLIYSMADTTVQKIHQDPDNVIFLHLHKDGTRSDSEEWEHKDFRPAFLKNGKTIWAVQKVDMKTMKFIETGIWNTRLQKQNMFSTGFYFEQCGVK